MAFSAEAAKQQQAAILAKDSGAGFFIEEDEDVAPTGITSKPTVPSRSIGNNGTGSMRCEECSERFDRSFLWTHFELDVCDACREDRGKHCLITRTDAKNEFLLKDCDLDIREPALKFLVKRNLHEGAKGDMKLYLRSQVLNRAIEVYGSEEAISVEKEKRSLKRKDRKQKAFNKKITELRKSVRSSLYTRNTGSQDHVHEFGEEVCVDEENDLYEKICQTCEYVNRYEKL